jgi:hypothetical protein
MMFGLSPRLFKKTCQQGRRLIETSRAVFHRERKATGLEATRRLSTFI